MTNWPKVNLNLSKRAGLVLAVLVAIASPMILDITRATELPGHSPSVVSQNKTAA